MLSCDLQHSRQLACWKVSQLMSPERVGSSPVLGSDVGGMPVYLYICCRSLQALEELPCLHEPASMPLQMELSSAQ